MGELIGNGLAVGQFDDTTAAAVRNQEQDGYVPLFLLCCYFSRTTPSLVLLFARTTILLMAFSLSCYRLPCARFERSTIRAAEVMQSLLEGCFRVPKYKDRRL